MKLVEKVKAQKILDKIESNNFDENDVDSLFMRLRAYSHSYKVFREIADFVAHNDLRDRGITNQSLETMYLRMKFFIEYNSEGKTLDLSRPIPSWILTLMQFQVDKCLESVLKQKYNVSAPRLKSRIVNSFKINKKEKTVYYKQGKRSQNTFEAIQYVMSFVSGNPIFTQDQLINELVGVLEYNGFDLTASNIYSLSDRITLCVLLLLHKAEFNIRGHKTASCNIQAEKQSILHDACYVDVEGKPVEHHESFGNLSILGSVTVLKDGRDLNICHQIMSTNLSAESWCSEKLFTIESLDSGLSSHMYKKLNLEGGLTIDSSFKLAGL